MLESDRRPLNPNVAKLHDQSENDLEVRDLPDGSCPSPRRIVKSLNFESDHSATIEVKYVGSFPVVGENQDQRMECVRKMLLDMKNVNKTRPVLLAISLSGIKVCSNTGESILMAHALKRISYATCHPEFCQFSFLAREPKAHTNIQHCHVFLTKSAQEAEELNSVVASAFNVAYACQRQSQVICQPNFNELIRQQMEMQREGLKELNRQQEEALVERLCQISTPHVDQRLDERHQKQAKEREDYEKRFRQGIERTSWAKKLCEPTSHTHPFPDEPPLRPSLSSTSCLIPISNSIPEDVSKQSRGLLEVGEQRAFKDGNSCVSYRPLHIQQNADTTMEEAYLCPVPCCSEVSKMCTSSLELEFPVCHHLVNEGREERSGNPPSRPNSSGESPGGQGSHGNEAQAAGGRPLSGKYQNDEGGVRSTSRDSEGRDIYQGPPTPIRHDSLRKTTSSQGTLCDELREAAWYQPGVPREVALEILSQQDIGSFVIRDSTTHPGCYALSVKVPRYDNPGGISHYLITRTAKGLVKIKGLEKEWPTLSSLVTHHTVMRELLPCLLHMPRPSNAPAATATASLKDLDKDACDY